HLEAKFGETLSDCRFPVADEPVSRVPTVRFPPGGIPPNFDGLLGESHPKGVGAAAYVVCHVEVVGSGLRCCELYVLVLAPTLVATRLQVAAETTPIIDWPRVGRPRLPHINVEVGAPRHVEKNGV